MQFPCGNCGFYVDLEKLKFFEVSYSMSMATGAWAACGWLGPA